MKLIGSKLTILLALLMAPQLAVAKTDCGNINNVLKVGSLRRVYTVHLPPQGITTNIPVVFVLHGFLATKDYVAWDTEMSKYADDNGFMVVYPQGVGFSWNAGNCCGKAARSNADDISFILSIVEDLKAKYKIDTREIFATGFSNGAMLCYRIAQEIPDIFAAVACVEGSLRSTSISPKGPISVLIIHDEKDKVFRFEGGTGHWLGYKIKSDSILETVKYWVKSNDCAPEPSFEKNAGYEKQTYSGGKDSTTVCLYKVSASGHVWPGGKESRLFHKSRPPAISASREVIDFFFQHPKHHVDTI